MNKTKSFHNIIIILLLLASIAVFASKVFSVFSVDVPRELREMNIVAFANAFSEGNNPYSRSVLEIADPPAATNLYGFVVPLIMSFFVRITSFTGMSVLRACETATLIIELIGFVFISGIIHRRTKNWPISLAGALTVYSCYWRYAPFGGAFPDQWGMTVGFILLYFIEMDEEKKAYKPGLYAFILVLLFYIKQYFVFWTFGVLVYLFIKDREKSYRLILWGIVDGLISIVIVFFAFPLYFTETFPVASGSTGNGGLSYSVSQIPEQILWSYKFCVPMVLVAVVYIIIRSVRRSKSSDEDVFHYVSIEVCQMICVLPFVILIARNEGTRYTYYLQLWWPFVLIFSICMLWEIVNSFFADKRIPGILVISFVMLYAIWDCNGMIISNPLNNEEQLGWKRAYEILSEYEGGNILVSPHLTAFCLDKGIPAGDYGQAEFNSQYSMEQYNKNRLYTTIFPDAAVIFEHNIDYSNKVIDRTHNRIYDCIAITDSGNYGLSEEEILSSGYTKLEEIDLAAGNEVLTTGFYIR